MTRGLPIAIGLCVVMLGAGPIALVVARAFSADASLAGVLAPLGETLFASLLGAALATAIAVPAAWLLERTDAGSAGLGALLYAPAVVPPYVLAVAWILLANPRTGLLVRGLGVPLDVYSRAGLVLVLASTLYPLVLAQTRAALVGIDASLEEAARLSGASPLRVLRDITWPLIAPAALGAGVLAALQAAASFGVPYLLAGQAHRPVLTAAIYEALGLGTPAGDGRAATGSLVLLAAASVGLLAAATLARRARVTVGAKTQRPAVVRLGRLRPIARGLLGALATLAVLGPLGTLAATSLLRSFGRGFAWDNLSFEHWVGVLGQPRVREAALTSLGLAAGAAAIVALLGLIFCYAHRQMRNRRAGRLLSLLVELPYAVPGTVLALGLVMAFAREVRFIVLDRVTIKVALLGTPWLLLIAYAVKELAVGVRAMDAALGRIDPAHLEAARVSGASPLRTLVDVVAPLCRPALAAAFLLVFLPLLSEVTLSVLLVGPGTETLGTVLFELQSYADPAAAAVLATLLSIAVAALALVRHVALRALPEASAWQG